MFSDHLMAFSVIFFKDLTAEELEFECTGCSVNALPHLAFKQQSFIILTAI